MGGKKEIYRDVRFFHGFLHFFLGPCATFPMDLVKIGLVVSA